MVSVDSHTLVFHFFSFCYFLLPVKGCHIAMPTINQHGLWLTPSPTDDPRDPLRWPTWLKLSVILSTSLANFVSNMGGAGLSVAVPVLMQQFQRSQADITRLLTV